MRTWLALLLTSFSAGLAAQDTRVVRPKEIDGVLVNPGIGFTTLNRFNGDPLNEGTKWTEGYPIQNYAFSGSLEVRGQPMTSIAYLRIYWRFVEPEMGKYNWAMLDQVLRTARERKQTLMLRVAPYGTEADNDVPEWYRQLAGDERAKGLPEKWRTDPENPLYVKHFTALVRELGKRYDGHPDLELVDVSIVGAWGEGEHTERLAEPTMRALVDSYIEGFRKTPLNMQPTDRRTNTYALSKAGAGWRADCLGDMRCVSGAGWCHMFDAYPRDIVNFGLAEAWKKGPVALEACWVMQHWKNQGWDVDYIIEQSLKWHISSFNNKSSAVPEEWRPQVERWLKRMGYRYVLRRFSYPAVVRSGEKLAFTSWWENKGVAPCYRRYPLALRLKGAGGSVVVTTGADIRTWLPGDIVFDDAVTLPAGIRAGEYELAIALVDEGTRAPNVKLAIAGMDGEGWYPLGRIAVGR
ncbi:MAG: DUF4832 domain-containing protein [Candidatus Solibacter usitatus]|nr:DUF4832 domain-containing protein [Candidatus Solibacter usitatus]